MVKAKEPENQGYLREHLWHIREFALRCLRWFRLFQILAGVRLDIAPTRRFGAVPAPNVSGRSQGLECGGAEGI
jgi:hypothetical protein